MAQAIVQRACAKLRSAIGDEAVVRLNFTGDLRDMLEALEAIQPLLDKAEMRPLWDMGGVLAAGCLDRRLQDHRYGRRAAGREITGCCNDDKDAAPPCHHEECHGHPGAADERASDVGTGASA